MKYLLNYLKVEKNLLLPHGVIEMFFYSAYANLIEFPWILDSSLPERHYFNKGNFLNPSPQKSIQFLNFFSDTCIEDLISRKAWNAMTIICITHAMILYTLCMFILAFLYTLLRN
jgi:hypothetical protein